jgi:hypothetical protein
VATRKREKNWTARDLMNRRCEMRWSSSMIRSWSDHAIMMLSLSFTLSSSQRPPHVCLYMMSKVYSHKSLDSGFDPWILLGLMEWSSYRL